jgi:hypothetical protein
MIMLIAERDKLTCIVNSFVDVQDAIPPQSTLRSRNCFHRHVHKPENRIVVERLYELDEVL